MTNQMWFLNLVIYQWISLGLPLNCMKIFMVGTNVYFSGRSILNCHQLLSEIYYQKHRPLLPY